ncbi:hypothetical protein Tco_0162245 [Tanacetum coccineum]
MMMKAPAGSNQGESTKRRRHDSSASGSAQPPSKDSEQSTKNKLDSNASAAQQPLAHTSSAWQITDIRDTPPGPSMQRSDHQSEQSSDDNPITDEGHVSDPEDTDNAHIPKVPAATWFKPIPEEERPATPEPEWTIPSNDYPEPENNWANVYATTYQDPKENKLQRKTGDIRSFIKWFCKRTRKKKLCKAILEGLTFNLVKAFHNNNVSLPFQMDKCHKLLTDKFDLVNPKGHQILHNVYEPLPLGGPPGQNTMAKQNVPAQAPTRTDEQILPRSAWLQIGKSNLAFSASASVPAIYIQQFWNTMKHDEKTGVYCCQVHEQWFNLSADLLRKALDITLVDPAHPYELPPTGDTVIDFVNQLGYPEPVEFKPESSSSHLLGDDFLLGNLKFIPKGETNEVFGMAIPKPLITKAIQKSLYYPKYLEIVAKNTKKTPQESASKQSEHGTKRAPPKKPTPVKPTKPAPVKQTKPPLSKLPKSPKKKPSKITPSRKFCKGKPSLVDEEDEAQQEPEP